MELRYFMVIGLVILCLAEVLLWYANKYVGVEKSYPLLKVRMALIYVGEILILFGVFAVVATSPKSPLGYDETSALKMFLDFVAFYQISVFVSFKTYDSLQAIPYRKATRMCTILMHMIEDGQISEALKTIRKIQGNMSMPRNMREAFQSFEEMVNSFEERAVRVEGDIKAAQYDLARVVETYIVELESRLDVLQSQATGSLLLRCLHRFKE